MHTHGATEKHKQVHSVSPRTRASNTIARTNTITTAVVIQGLDASVEACC